MYVYKDLLLAAAFYNNISSYNFTDNYITDWFFTVEYRWPRV